MLEHSFEEGETSEKEGECQAQTFGEEEDVLFVGQ